MTKAIIFHHPEPITNRPASGSQLRPLQMLTAFRQLGYRVDEVVGYVEDRKEGIDTVYMNIRDGCRYEFLYSE
jgi:hypothetical protein